MPAATPEPTAIPAAPAATATAPCVVGYDGSPASLAAVRWALRYAEPARRIVAVAALGSEPVPVPAGGLLAVRPGEVGHRSEQVAAAWARDAEAFDTEVDLIIERGHPAEVLLRAARDRDAAMIVLGHRDRRLAALRGSVAHHLLEIADRPVVVVPE